MACGLPVVATNASGISDIFKRGEADGGVIVEPESVTSLAAAMARLLDDDKKRLEIGMCARARAEAAFSLSAVGRDLRRVLLREAA
jgi:glycosyltransferase involved in cell wall biosynthesis